MASQIRSKAGQMHTGNTSDSAWKANKGKKAGGEDLGRLTV